MGYRPHKCDNKETKKVILSLKVSCDTDSELKHGCLINQFCAIDLAKSANYVSSGFSENS